MSTSKFFRLQNTNTCEFKLHEFATCLINESPNPYNKKITCSGDVKDLLTPFYQHNMQIKEQAFALYLNQQNKPIGIYKISEGGITGTTMDVRLIAKTALDLLATCVIISHNHPSGNLQPSTADKQITEKIKNALQLFDIKLFDHLIITQHSYYSFADEGLL